MSVQNLGSFYKQHIRTPLRTEVRKQTKQSKDFVVKLDELSLANAGLTPVQKQLLLREVRSLPEWSSELQELRFDNKFKLNSVMDKIFFKLPKATEREKASATGTVPSPREYTLTKGTSKRKIKSKNTTVTLAHKYNISGKGASSLLSINIPDFGLTPSQHDMLVQKSLRGLGNTALIEREIGNYIVHRLLFGKAAKPRQKSEKFSSNEKSAVATSYESTQTVTSTQLRDDRGQFSSVKTVLGKLQQPFFLLSAIKANMGTPRLNWRTGRFASSVKVTDINQSGRNIGIKYSYMKRPYELFENPSYRNYTIERRPTKLIEGTIRDLAVSLVSNKFNLNIREKQ